MNPKLPKIKPSLFITGFLQVYFVAINTVLLSRNVVLGVLIASFLISFTWSYNVKKIAFGGLVDRLVYSLGASVGAVSGLLTVNIIL